MIYKPALSQQSTIYSPQGNPAKGVQTFSVHFYFSCNYFCIKLLKNLKNLHCANFIGKRTFFSFIFVNNLNFCDIR